MVVAAPGCAPSDSDWVEATPDGALEASRAFIGESANGESAALYFAVRNRGAERDALTDVVVEGAGQAEIHRSVESAGRMSMSRVAALEVPQGTVRLTPGGTHVMLQRWSTLPTPGDSLRVTLRFRSGRTLEVRAEVRRLVDLDGILDFTDPGVLGPATGP